MTTLALKAIPRLPGAVLGSSPVVVTAGGLNYTVSLDMASLIASVAPAVGSTFQPLDADLTAISLLGSTGIAVRTAADTWAQRSITGTANEITLTNGNGVAGNPTVSLPAALTFTGKTITGGTFSGVAITGTFAGTVAFSAGTVSVAPLTFTAGTNLTTPAAGAMEYDGTVHYATHAANERGAVNAEQWICNTATYTLTSTTSAQALFNSPANGRVTVAGSTTYQFECQFELSSMSASSGSFGFAFGGTAAISGIKWRSLAQKSAALGAVSTPSHFATNSASGAAIVTASTTTTGFAEVRGVVRVSTGGTIIPQVSLGVAAAAVVGVGSFFRIWPVGTDAQVSLGNWS